MNLKEKLRKKDKLVFGKNSVLKLARKGELVEIIITKNAVSKDEINQLKNFSEVKIEEVPENSEELGALCKKPFSISVLGIKK